MKVLLIPNSFPPRIGGLETAVSKLAQALGRWGHRVSVITNNPGQTIGEDSTTGVSIFRLPLCVPRIVCAAGWQACVASVGKCLLSPFVGVPTLVRFRRLLWGLSPDIVNLHYIGENALWCYLAGTPKQAKLVVSVHGNDIERYDDRGWLSQHLTRVTLRRADRVFSNSSALLANVIQLEPSVAGKSRVMPNGIEPSAFDEVTGFHHPRRYVLCVASLVPKKGQDVLLRAFQAVGNRHPEVDLLFAGDGRERARYERLAVGLGIEKKVCFLGLVPPEEVRRLLAGCEMLVQPSRSEAFGIALLEAMAAGKPVVATRVGGIPELVAEGQTGLLVSPEDPRTLSEAICTLLDDRSLASRLGSKAREVARDYGWDRIAERYIAAYLEVLAE